MPTSTAMFRPHRWEILLLLGVSFVARLVVLLSQSANLSADPDGYRRMAENVYQSGVLSDQRPPALPDTQHQRAESPQDLHPTAYRPPLYPLLLTVGVASPLGFETTVIALHLVLGMFTIWLTVELAIQLGLGRHALLAGAGVALDPILLHQSTLVMTETLATFFTTLALWTLIKASPNYHATNNNDANPATFELTGSELPSNELPAASPRLSNAALAGIALALAALCRPTFLVFLLTAGVALWFVWKNTRARRSACGMYLLAALVVLSPWVIRNTLQFGRPVMTTTHGGYTFHLANNPGFYNSLRSGESGTVWRSDEPFTLYPGSSIRTSMTAYPARRLQDPALKKFLSTPSNSTPSARTELLLDRLHYADAWRAIRAEPGMFVWSILVRWGRFFQPLPHAARRATASPEHPAEHDRSQSLAESRATKAVRYLIAGWYLALYPLALLGVWSLGKKLWQTPWGWGFLLLLCFLAVHAFYWTDMRMRGPVMPVLALLAAAGAKRLTMLARGLTPAR